MSLHGCSAYAYEVVRAVATIHLLDIWNVECELLVGLHKWYTHDY